MTNIKPNQRKFLTQLRFLLLEYGVGKVMPPDRTGQCEVPSTRVDNCDQQYTVLIATIEIGNIKNQHAYEAKIK